MNIKDKNDIGIFLLRLSIASMMLVHGLPKLMKLFSGDPIKFADPIGMGMTISLILTVFAEVFCSFAILIGFKTRIAAFTLGFTMFVAAFIVHGQDTWSSKEKALLFLCAYISLIFTGGGKYSVSK